jgi:hypothetical protein
MSLDTPPAMFRPRVAIQGEREAMNFHWHRKKREAKHCFWALTGIVIPLAILTIFLRVLVAVFR